MEGAVSTVQAHTLARTCGDTCTHVHTGTQAHVHTHKHTCASTGRRTGTMHTHTPVPVALVAMEQVRGPGQPGTRATRGVTVADTGGRERRHFSRQHMSLQGSRNKKAKNASMALRRSGRHDPTLDVRPGDLRRSLLRASPSHSQRTHSALHRGPSWDGAHGIGYRRGNVTSGRSGTVRWGARHWGAVVLSPGAGGGRGQGAPSAARSPVAVPASARLMPHRPSGAAHHPPMESRPGKPRSQGCPRRDLPRRAHEARRAAPALPTGELLISLGPRTGGILAGAGVRHGGPGSRCHSAGVRPSSPG